MKQILFGFILFAFLVSCKNKGTLDRMNDKKIQEEKAAFTEKTIKDSIENIDINNSPFNDSIYQSKSNCENEKVAFGNLRFGDSFNEVELKLNNDTLIHKYYIEIGEEKYKITYGLFHNKLYQLEFTGKHYSEISGLSYLNSAWQELNNVIRQQYGSPYQELDFPTRQVLSVKPELYTQYWRCGTKILSIRICTENLDEGRIVLGGTFVFYKEYYLVLRISDKTLMNEIANERKAEAEMKIKEKKEKMDAVSKKL